MAPQSLARLLLLVHLMFLLRKRGVFPALTLPQHVTLLPEPATPPSPALIPRPSRRSPNGGGEAVVVQEEDGEVEVVVKLDHQVKVSMTTAVAFRQGWDDIPTPQVYP